MAGFAAGAALAQPGTGSAWAGGLAFAGITVLALAAFSRNRTLVLMAVLAVAATAGNLRQSSALNRLESGRAVPVDEPVRVMARLTEAPERFDDRSVLWLDGRAIHDGQRWQPLSGHFRVAVLGPADDFARGDTIVALLTFDRPRAYRNPGAFDYIGHLARRGVARVGVCRSPRLVARTECSRSLLAGVDHLRERYIRRLSGSGTDGGALMAALMAGEQAALSRPVQQAFSRTGIAHLLSVSGLHLALAAGIFYFVLIRLWKRSPALCGWLAAQRAAALLSIPPVIGYALLTGLRVPTQRALVMVLTFLVAVSLDRRRQVWDAFWLAIAVTLFAWPDSLLEPSFQLSYLAVAGIVYFYPRLAAAGHRPKSTAAQELDAMEQSLGLRRHWTKRAAVEMGAMLGITLAAQWAVMPVQLGVFYRMNPLGLVYNLVAIPYTGYVLMPLGIIGSLAAVIWPAAGEWLMLVGAWAAELLVILVKFGAERLPGTGLWPPLSWLGAVSWYAAGIGMIEGLVAWRRGQWSWQLFSPVRNRLVLRDPILQDPTGRPRFVSVILAASVLLFLVSLAGLIWPRHRLPAGSVSAIDVGQGQSLIVRGRDGATLLVDGGGSHDGLFDVGERVVAPCLLCLGLTRLDAVVLTHGHPDHSRGLAFIMRNFSVGELWVTPGRDEFRDELREIAAERRIPVRQLDSRTGAFTFHDLKLRVLHPPPTYPGDNENNKSLVLTIQDEALSVLLPGDIERDAEAGLMGDFGPRGQVQPGILTARVMVVPHHGSRTSSTADFVAAVSPAVALVSAAGVRQSHLPAPSVLDSYRRLGISIADTSQMGMAVVSGNPPTISRPRP